MGTETAKSKDSRIARGDFVSYLHGHGVDIGCGGDPLTILSGTVDPWDIEQGDAQYMAEVEDSYYDFVYSSHCLEHMENVPLALNHWCRILKPGGYLYIVVPDWEIYEKQRWPSHFNTGHRASFSINVSATDHPHFRIGDIEDILNSNGLQLVAYRIEDQGYDYTLPANIDQTAELNAQAQLCFIGKKFE